MLNGCCTKCTEILLPNYLYGKPVIEWCKVQDTIYKKKTQQQQKKHLRRERKEKHFESESPPVCYWRVYQSKAQHIWDLNAVLLQIHSFYEK